MIRQLRQRHFDDAVCLQPLPDRFYRSDPLEVIAAVREGLERRGVRVVRKRVGSMTTSLRRVLYTSADRLPIDKMTSVDDAAHLMHEYQHVIDSFRRARYLVDPVFRWVIETRAHRRQMLAFRDMGTPVKRVLAIAYEEAKEYPAQYVLGALFRRSDVIDAAYRCMTHGIRP